MSESSPLSLPPSSGTPHDCRVPNSSSSFVLQVRTSSDRANPRTNHCRRGPPRARFCLLRSAEQRRRRGATYTPPANRRRDDWTWAESEGTPPATRHRSGGRVRSVPGRRSREVSRCQLIGVDVDPLATLMLRANAASEGVRESINGPSHRLSTSSNCRRSRGPPSLSAIRPMFVITILMKQWKTWFATTAKRFGSTRARLRDCTYISFSRPESSHGWAIMGFRHRR